MEILVNKKYSTLEQNYKYCTNRKFAIKLKKFNFCQQVMVLA